MILTQSKRRELIKSRKKFQEISDALKNEFFGLDKTIDEIMQSIESWFLFSEYQTRPLVVNLWGMTGTGKTSIVRRLVRLLKMENSFIHADMGEQVESYTWTARNKFEESIVFKDKKKSIICLDEFQLCRTIEDKREIDRTGVRIFWELIDTGLVAASDLIIGSYNEFSSLLKVLKQCLANRVEVKNGKIIRGKDIYLSIMKHAEDYNALWSLNIDYDEAAVKDVCFLPESSRIELYDLYNDIFDTTFQFEKYILSLDGKGTINLLQDAVNKSQNKKEIDLRQSLIFVVGNLDEVFEMSGEHNPDIDPDIFCEHTLGINTTNIKEGLAKRFRIEQIARLGNNHIIYPALNSSAYYKLIKSELKKIAIRFKKQIFADLVFDNSINELIFREGVFPFQGARPVLTSIVRLIDSNIGKVIAEALNSEPDTDEFKWSFKDGSHYIEFIVKGEVKDTIKIESELKLDSSRQSKNNDKQALVAVHECGHAIATALSSRILPTKIVSVSPLNDSGGFCQVMWHDEIISKKNIRHRIISSLGGIIAEKMIFGEDNLSRGSGSDLEMVSLMANESIKQQGMGFSVKIFNSHEFELKDSSEINLLAEEEAELLIESCRKEAETILGNNLELLIEMAKYLTVNSKMDMGTIKEFMPKYSNEDWVKTEGFISNEKYYNYREILFNSDKSKSNVSNVPKVK